MDLTCDGVRSQPTSVQPESTVQLSTESKIANQAGWFSVRYFGQHRYIYVNSHTYGKVWVNLCMFGLLHILYIYAVCRVVLHANIITWAFCLLYGEIAGIGVTCGAHRLWTHRCYQAKLPLRIILCIAHTMAGQNDLYTWVRDHRLHHKYTETDADPHNSMRGMFFAHVGWLLTKKHPDVLIKGSTIDMSDVASDPVVKFQRKWYVPIYFLLRFVVPIYIPVKFWSEDLGYSFVAQAGTYMSTLHATWFVNSAAHWLGEKPYNKRIQPRDNILTSVITLGEGFHNFHHTFPWDYTIGEFEWNYDIGKRFIEAMHKLGLAFNLKRASLEQIERTKRLVEQTKSDRPLYRDDHPYLFPHDYS